MIEVPIEMEVSTSYQPKTGSGSDLPDVTVDDNGKILKVINGEWNKGDETKELPDVTQQDDGKVLTVVNGEWNKANVPSSSDLPDVTQEDDGKILRVVEGEWAKSTESSGGLSNDTKDALLNLFQVVAYTIANAQEYYDALENALYPKNLVSISAVFTQGANVIYDTDFLDDLRQYLVVTAHYDDETSETISAYTLSGTLSTGTSTITVSYGGKTTTFTVTVTHATTTYSVTNTLSGCTSSNSATTVAESTTYSATITASTGYTLTNATVSVVMGETDITSTAYNNGTISIASVSGNITITIVAELNITPGVWYDLTPSMYTATRSDVTINSGGFIHQENVVTTTPETKYPEIILDNRITSIDFDIDNTGAYTWLIMAGTKDNYGAIALTQASGGYPAQMTNGQIGKTSGLGGTKLNGCPYGNGHYTVTKDLSGITISKTGGASVTYTTANQPIYDYGDSSSWILGFCIQPSSPTGNGYKNIKVMFGSEVTE